jgi:hypothetical protein
VGVFSSFIFNCANFLLKLSALVDHDEPVVVVTVGKVLNICSVSALQAVSCTTTFG